MNTGFLIPAILFLLCLAIRSVYEQLKESREIDPESKPIFIFIFSSMCVLWVSWFFLCIMDPYKINIPNVIRAIGFLIFLVGIFLAVGALIQLKGVENIDHLVTRGLFNKLRHPMYMGFISWILGWSIFNSAASGMAIGLVGIVNILWWRRLEESRLEIQFGEDYKEYRKTTWF